MHLSTTALAVGVYNGDYGIPCGGTHVKMLDDVGKVIITKIKCKKGITKVSYSVEGIN
jgi:Ser-tRNA(Ala) deacylase AlaX